MNIATHPVAEEVMAYADDEIGGALKESLAEHLAECEECRRAVAQFQDDAKVLYGWSVETIPPRVEEAIQKKASGHSGTSLRWRFPVWSKWALGLGLSAAAIFFLAERPSTHMEQFTRSAPLAMSSAPQPPARLAAGRKQLEVATQAHQRALQFKEQEDLNSSLQREPVDKVGVAINSVSGIAGGQALISGAPPPPVAAAMIARTVSLTLVVKDFVAARANLDAILARHHGYAAELTANTAEGAPRTLQASLRVPAPELAATLSELKLLGRVENESQSGEEVTEQHADLVARLKNARETEQRLQAILQQRAGKISDVLAVEQEIARVRGEIEEMEAQQKSLEHRVEFATVNLQLSDEYRAQLVIPPLSAGTRLHNALVEGSRNVGETLVGIVVFFVEYGPMLLIWLLLLGTPAFFLWRRYRRSLAAI